MRKHVIALLIITLAVFLAYSNSFNSPWIMDDVLALKTIEASDFESLPGFRQITYFTFLLNAMVLPLSPASLRFVNILIHILNAFLVYVLAYKTLLLWFKDSEEKTAMYLYAFSVAFLGSTIFALHPVNINAVVYVIQRGTSLATFFVLLSLLAYIQARQSPGNVRALLFYAVCGISLVIGIFSKENAVIAVPLILLYDVVFISKFNIREIVKNLSIITGIGFVIFVFVSYTWNLHSVIIDLSGFFLNPNELLPPRGWMAINVSWTPLQHFLTEFRVLSRYLFLFIFPLPQFLVFDLLGYPVSTGITTPITTLFSMILVSCLILFSLVTLKRFPLLSFGILWYFLAISIESFLALGSDFYFEHRNYLPLSGMVIGIAGHGVVNYRGKLNSRKAWSIVIICSVVLGSLTFWRNFVWEDSFVLWKDTLNKNQFNHRAHYIVGNAYQREGSRDKAIEHYKMAIDLSPNYADAYISLGVAYISEGRKKEALEFFQTAIEIKPDYAEAHYNLGKVYQLEGLLDNAVRHYKIAIELKPQYPDAHSNLGVAYESQGLIDKAIEHYRIATEVDHDYAAAYYNLGHAYQTQGFIDKAIKNYQIAIQLNPNYSEAHINLGIAYKSQGLIERANKHFNIARRLRPEIFRSGNAEY
jgi:tetratricopeptide (TPR) repeat protein